jgi:hypothetical protein
MGVGGRLLIFGEGPETDNLPELTRLGRETDRLSFLVASSGVLSWPLALKGDASSFIDERFSASIALEPGGLGQASRNVMFFIVRSGLQSLMALIGGLESDNFLGDWDGVDD